MIFDVNLVLTVSAIITAYVAVFKSFKLIDNRFLPIVALLIAAVFVLVPTGAYDKLVLISTIGLGASGVYQLSKSKDGAK